MSSNKFLTLFSTVIEALIFLSRFEGSPRRTYFLKDVEENKIVVTPTLELN